MRRFWLGFFAALSGCEILLDSLPDEPADPPRAEEQAPRKEAKKPRDKTSKKGEKKDSEKGSARGSLGGGAIEVFFTTPALVYPDVPEKRTLQDFEKRLVADIDAATSSVDAATFEYNLDSLRDALIRAKKRGIKVRLALDEEHLEEKEEMAAWAHEVEGAKIPISWEQSTNFLHSKFVIIDDKIAWTGSWNFTNNDTYRNNNNILRLSDSALVENYRAEFAQMFAGRFGPKKKPSTPTPQVTLGSTKVENYFSPEDGVLSHLLPHLEGAKKSIYFLAFSFTEDKIGALMVEKKKAGLTVQGVFEKRNAEGTGSELGYLRENGIEVLDDGNCYTMHHKVIIIDERTVITGSYNFTARAEQKNDENVIILNDKEAARLFLDEYRRVYEQAAKGTKCGK
jgi:phosphatidylserine/phosphatidylglycerophosphate/cardiolipin synthase-like enzyme